MPRHRSAGIVIRDNTVLVMHRINKGEEYWVFPGGGVDDGETPMQALERECLEEVGVKII